MKDLIKRARKLAKPFRVTDGGFRLKDIDPAEQKKRFLERIEEPEKN